MKLMRVHTPEFWATSPTGTLSTLQQEINRLFDVPFGGLAQGGELFHDWAPALDLFEDNDNLLAQLELPGVAKQDVTVSVHDGVLSVSGERKQESESKDEGCFRRERFHGRFHRAVTLPKPVKVDAIKASLKDGILTISMPKTEEARPRQIQVNQD